MIKGYKIRIYPTKEQEQLIWKHIYSCRYIWNWMLSKQEELYKQGEKCVSAFSMMSLLKPLKNDGEHTWLYEVSNKSLQRTCQDLETAYFRFFNKISGFPKFKSKKRSKLSFPACCENFYFKNNLLLNIEKIGKVKYKTDFNFPIGKGQSKFSNVRVSNVNNKWFVSFGMVCENQVHELTDINMGIDLGIKDLAVVEFNNEKLVFHNINKSHKMKELNKKLKHTQRSISRKYEANKQGNKFIKTNNIIREEIKLRKLYFKITNIRHNYIHQTTHQLVSLLPQRVVMENLNVSGMIKNRHLSKSIQEQCFYEFIKQMQYKCEWNGIEFVQANRFFPSSKLCSNCGCVKDILKLSERTYVCEHCGNIIDRDYNAAINLSRYIA